MGENSAVVSFLLDTSPQFPGAVTMLSYPKAVLFVALAVTVPTAAAADPIVFSLFGGNSMTLGENVQVKSGAVGGNQGTSAGTNSQTHALTGSANYASGQNVQTKGDVVFNGNVAIATNGRVDGNIHSGGNVTIAANVQVTGNVYAAGTVTLQSNARVAGEVHAGAATGTAITLGSNAQVGKAVHNAGTTVSLAESYMKVADVVGTPTPPSGYTTAALPTQTAFLAGTTSYSVAENAALTLAPGVFDDLVLGSNGVLNLTAGNYTFDTWKLGDNTRVYFDLSGGDIFLSFAGLVSMGSNVQMYLKGGDASGIYAELHKNLIVGNNSRLYGTWYGSGATSDFTLGQNLNATGAFWAANNLNVGNNSQINFLPSMYASSQPSAVAPIPEPATLVLLGVGLLGVAARARARTKRR